MPCAFQQKTRDQLGGPFWSDYLDSIEGLERWNDGNPVISRGAGMIAEFRIISLHRGGSA